MSKNPSCGEKIRRVAALTYFSIKSSHFFSKVTIDKTFGSSSGKLNCCGLNKTNNGNTKATNKTNN